MRRIALSLAMLPRWAVTLMVAAESARACAQGRGIPAGRSRVGPNLPRRSRTPATGRRLEYATAAKLLNYLPLKSGPGKYS